MKLELVPISEVTAGMLIMLNAPSLDIEEEYDKGNANTRFFDEAISGLLPGIFWDPSERPPFDDIDWTRLRFNRATLAFVAAFCIFHVKHIETITVDDGVFQPYDELVWHVELVTHEEIPAAGSWRWRLPIHSLQVPYFYRLPLL